MPNKHKRIGLTALRYLLNHYGLLEMPAEVRVWTMAPPGVT